MKSYIHFSHMASEKWEVGLKQEFTFFKYPTQGTVETDRTRMGLYGMNKRNFSSAERGEEVL